MKIKGLVAAVALAVCASGAFANDQSIVLTPSGAGMFSADFASSQTESGLFVDMFTFSLPAGAGSPTGSGAVTFASSTGPVSLVVASLDAANGVSVASPPDADTIAIPSTLSFANAMAPFTLTVLGFAGDPFADPMALASSYSGSITFSADVAAVPEPETLGLMLAGLGAMGLFVRRRKTSARPLA